MSETEIDASRAPLLDHLIELRRRLLYCIAAVVVAFAVSYFYAEQIFAILVQPLLHAGQKTLIYTQIFEAFFVKVKVAFFAAMMIAFPVIANQLWQFVAPGLYRKERRALLPFLFATPVLFALGASLAYFVAIPMALHFLLGFQGDIGGVRQEALPGIGNYLSFVMQFPVRLRARLPVAGAADAARTRGDRHPQAADRCASLCDRRCDRDRRGADPARSDEPGAARGPLDRALRTCDRRDLFTERKRARQVETVLE